MLILFLLSLISLSNCEIIEIYSYFQTSFPSPCRLTYNFNILTNDSLMNVFLLDESNYQLFTDNKDFKYYPDGSDKNVNNINVESLLLNDNRDKYYLVLQNLQTFPLEVNGTLDVLSYTSSVDLFFLLSMIILPIICIISTVLLLLFLYRKQRFDRNRIREIGLELDNEYDRFER